MPSAAHAETAKVSSFTPSTAIQYLKPISAEELRKIFFDLKPFSSSDGAKILAAMIAGAIKLGKPLSEVSARPNDYAESIAFDKIIERTRGNENLAYIREGQLRLGKQALAQIARQFERHFKDHLLLLRSEASEIGQVAAKSTDLSAQAAKHIFVGSIFRNQAAESFLHKVVNAAIAKNCLIQDLVLEVTGDEKSLLIGALKHSKSFTGKYEDCLKFSEQEVVEKNKRVTKHYLQIGEPILGFLKEKLSRRRDYAKLFN